MADLGFLVDYLNGPDPLSMLRDPRPGMDNRAMAQLYDQVFAGFGGDPFRYVVSADRGLADARGIGSLPADLGMYAGDDTLAGGELADPYGPVLKRFSALESGNGRARSNPDSNATGLYHFLPNTWDGVIRNYPDLGFTADDIHDDAKQEAAARRLLASEIVPALRKALGREPTGEEMYAAWGLGTPDAVKLFRTVKDAPDAPAHALFRPAVAASNPAIFYGDGGPSENPIPRTAAQVAAEYARRYRGAKPGAKPMDDAMEQDTGDLAPGLEDRLYAMAGNVASMRPTGGAGVSAIQPSGRAGISALGTAALDPYMQIARQITPQRDPTQDFWSALGAAGARIAASDTPFFGQALGQGLGAFNDTYAKAREARRADELRTNQLGLELYKAGIRDDKPVSLSRGGKLVNPITGQVIADNPVAEVPKTRTVRIGNEVVTQEWSGTMWREVGRGSAFRPQNDSERTTDFQRKLGIAAQLFPDDQRKQAEWASDPAGFARRSDPGQARLQAARIVARDPTVTDKAGAITAYANLILGDPDAVQRFQEAQDAAAAKKGGGKGFWSNLWPGNWWSSDDEEPEPSAPTSRAPAPATSPRSSANPESRYLNDRSSDSGDTALRGAPPPATGFRSWGDLRTRFGQLAPEAREPAIRRLRDAGLTSEQIDAITGQ